MFKHNYEIIVEGKTENTIFKMIATACIWKWQLARAIEKVKAEAVKQNGTHEITNIEVRKID